MSDEDDGYTYVLRRGGDGPFKVGRTKDVRARVMQLQTACAERLQVISVIEGSSHERRIHEELSPWRMRGEWFRPDSPIEDVLISLGLD